MHISDIVAYSTYFCHFVFYFLYENKNVTFLPWVKFHCKFHWIFDCNIYILGSMAVVLTSFSQVLR